MDDQWTRRVWPPRGRPAGQDETAPVTAELPPSARWYGTPAPPPRRRRRRVPPWALRLLVGFLALAAAASVIGALVQTILSRVDSTPTLPTTVTDSLAGVVYELPAGWDEGVVAPVTGFTSVAVHGDRATVMARPAERVDPAKLRPTLIELTGLYSRLLLRGDGVDVVEDRSVIVDSRQGYTRALRARYRDVVNQPTFMRVTLLTSPEGKSTVLLGLAHPDDPQSRTEIDAIMTGARSASRP